MLLNWELSYTEFWGFYECIGKNLTEGEFKTDILEKFCSTSRGITYRGFKDFWHTSIVTYGEQTIWSWLENLGYDKDLYSIWSWIFVLTIHCEQELAVTVWDAIQTDLDNRANIAIISKYGQELENKNKVKSYYTFSEQVHAYSYGVLNDSDKTMDVTIDCSASQNMLFSTKGEVIKKRVEPGKLEFMLHAQALQSAEQFVRSAKCWFEEVH